MQTRRKAGTYAGDQQWALDYEAATIAVLQPYMPLLLSHAFTARHAGTAEDRACMGDLQIDFGSTLILSRVRDSDCYQRDLTLRSWRSNGVETEVAKILNGAGKWYFYGWVDRHGRAFHEWMLIDLDIVRQRETIQHHQHDEKRNTDGTTGFIYIPRMSLHYDGAIRVQQKQQNGEVTMLLDDGKRYTAQECDEWLEALQLEEMGVAA